VQQNLPPRIVLTSAEYSPGTVINKTKSLNIGTTEVLHNIFKTRQNRLSIWWTDHTHNTLMHVDISKVGDENMLKDKIPTKPDLAQDDDHSINYALRT